MARLRRLSDARRTILEKMYNRPFGWFYGYGLADETGVNYSTVNAALKAWEKSDIVEGRRDFDHTPARNYYRLTTEGRDYATRALFEA